MGYFELGCSKDIKFRSFEEYEKIAQKVKSDMYPTSCLIEQHEYVHIWLQQSAFQKGAGVIASVNMNATCDAEGRTLVECARLVELYFDMLWQKVENEILKDRQMGS